jgi:HD-like signal output (HDOD) protein
MKNQTIESASFIAEKTDAKGKKQRTYYAVLLIKKSYLLLPTLYFVHVKSNDRVVSKRTFKRLADARKHFQAARDKIAKL